MCPVPPVVVCGVLSVRFCVVYIDVYVASDRSKHVVFVALVIPRPIHLLSSCFYLTLGDLDSHLLYVRAYHIQNKSVFFVLV